MMVIKMVILYILIIALGCFLIYLSIFFITKMHAIDVASVKVQQTVKQLDEINNQLDDFDGTLEELSPILNIVEKVSKKINSFLK